MFRYKVWMKFSIYLYLYQKFINSESSHLKYNNSTYLYIDLICTIIMLATHDQNYKFIYLDFRSKSEIFNVITYSILFLLYS